MQMVSRWGMSSMGLAALAPENCGPGHADKVMAEVDRMLAVALDSARRILAENRLLLETIVAELLAEETIDLDRLRVLWDAVTAGAADAADTDGEAEVAA